MNCNNTFKEAPSGNVLGFEDVQDTMSLAAARDSIDSINVEVFGKGQNDEEVIQEIVVIQKFSNHAPNQGQLNVSPPCSTHSDS